MAYKNDKRESKESVLFACLDEDGVMVNKLGFLVIESEFNPHWIIF